MSTLARRIIAPIVLGCCPRGSRCAVCGSAAREPDSDVVAALLDEYRGRGDGEVLVGFYGGPPPSPALLEAIGDLPFVVRVRPDLLKRAVAADLAARGCVGIELDALTFDDFGLRASRRPYSGARVREMIGGLGALGVRTGLVLAPGLPGTDADTALRDAAIAAGLEGTPRVDTVRILPVLVYEGSRLRRLHDDGLYRPLDVGDAVAICRAMLDLLEPAGVEVIRIGIQPANDGFGRAVAGPRHPSLRELVEGGRALSALKALCAALPPGADIAIRCAPPDEARTRGLGNQHLRALAAEFHLGSVTVKPDPALSRGQWVIAEAPPADVLPARVN